MTDEELKAVEEKVNEKVLESCDIEICETSMEKAREMGAMALFGEKYGSTVRVVNMGDYSIELCGGIHLKNTSQVGSFKIISENGIAAGVRRIEAVTGAAALKHYQQQEEEIKAACKIVKADEGNLVKKLEALVSEQKETAKELQKLKEKMATGAVDEIINSKEEINGVSVICKEVKDIDPNSLKTMGDDIKNRLANSVLVLICKNGEKVNLLAMATDDAVKAGVHCGNIIKQAATVCGGGGGGSPNMAQDGGKDASKIKEALIKAKEVIVSQLG